MNSIINPYSLIAGNVKDNPYFLVTYDKEASFVGGNTKSLVLPKGRHKTNNIEIVAMSLTNKHCSRIIRVDTDGSKKVVKGE